jgi:hypothetical protein
MNAICSYRTGTYFVWTSGLQKKLQSSKKIILLKKNFRISKFFTWLSGFLDISDPNLRSEYGQNPDQIIKTRADLK